ncbi:MAG: HNH endonuclease [Bacteroides sp.]|nr:HNH endonuclease [Bacteroides sp.]
MNLRLHTKNHRWGFFRGDHFLKLQLGPIRFYISTRPLKTKQESTTRRRFRHVVLERDGYTCQHCGRALDMSTLSIHHIKPCATHPELIYDADNCISLCKCCHVKLHRAQSLAEERLLTTVSVNPAMPTAAVIAMTN